MNILPVDAAPIPKDLKNEYPLNGIWKRVYYISTTGQKRMDIEGRQYIWQFDNNKLTKYREQSTVRSNYEIVYDPELPDSVFRYIRNSINRPCRYELRRNTLKIAFPNRNAASAPTRCAAGPSVTLYVFQRAKTSTPDE